MQLNISQHMKMSQQMKLAPRMIQSMEILQLPIMALQERIEQELEENVVLERRNGDSEAPDAEAEMARAREDAVATDVERRELVVDNDHNNEADFERLLEMSQEWSEDNTPSGSRPSNNRIDENSDRKHDAMSNMAARPPSLHEYLLEQFGFFDCSAEVRRFGEFLIQNLDDNGRLQSPLPVIVQLYLQLNGYLINSDDSEQALSLIQKLDPRGVGSRDIKECLLLQIDQDTPLRDVLITLISSHLEDIGQNRLPVIQRKTGYSLEMIKHAIEELQKLEPYPGRNFENRPVQAVTPDLFVELDEHGKYTIRLDDEYTPRLYISKRYRQLLRDGVDPKTKEYIKKKIDSAKWLIESIQQRQSTLKKVAQAIIDHQKDFLDEGPNHIVPLKMQQIADIVGVHVTTVSRAVDDKWIQAPRGLFPLRGFFGGGTTTSEGEEVAWNIIRLKMKDIVDKENKDDPLSDDALVEELAKHGFTLARRTVTKYRKAMQIPSSRQRRQY